MSQSPNGPWAVATTVPQVIYTIPPTSPMYNVTYVQIYNATPTTVVTGYTAGYNGAFVAAGVVMLGVGIAWPPPRRTTRSGSAIRSTTIRPIPYGGYGYHAAYNPYTGAYAHGMSAYGPYGGRSVGASYNPTTGTYARGASRVGPVRHGRRGAGLQPAHRGQRRELAAVRCLRLVWFVGRVEEREYRLGRSRQHRRAGTRRSVA